MPLRLGRTAACPRVLLNSCVSLRALSIKVQSHERRGPSDQEVGTPLPWVALWDSIQAIPGLVDCSIWVFGADLRVPTRPYTLRDRSPVDHGGLTPAPPRASPACP